MNLKEGIIVIKEKKIVVGVTDALTARICSADMKISYVWASSLVMSAMLGLKDDGVINLNYFLQLIQAIVKGSKCPVILDFDIGGRTIIEFQKNLKLLSRLGLGGLCIEDEGWPKVNAMLADPNRKLAKLAVMAKKIRLARKTLGKKTLIIARTHSLISGEGKVTLQKRISAYEDAGASAICVHYTGKEWGMYCATVNALIINRPLFVILSKQNTYPAEIKQMPQCEYVLFPNQIYRTMLKSVIAFTQAQKTALTPDFEKSKLITTNELFDTTNVVTKHRSK